MTVGNGQATEVGVMRQNEAALPTRQLEDRAVIEVGKPALVDALHVNAPVAQKGDHLHGNVHVGE